MKNFKIKKSTLMLLGFTLYSAVVYAYFIPRTEMPANRIALTVGTNAVVVIVLWLLYRRKEKMAERRKKDIEQNNK